MHVSLLVFGYNTQVRLGGRSDTQELAPDTLTLRIDVTVLSNLLQVEGVYIYFLVRRNLLSLGFFGERFHRADLCSRYRK